MKRMHFFNGLIASRGYILIRIKYNGRLKLAAKIFAPIKCACPGILLIISLMVICSLYSCEKRASKGEGPSPEKSPEEELATFQLDENLKIQLVASEPMVQDPVVIQFDPEGRLWVVEMRGFMPDIDGKGESERVGRISILQDTDLD